MQKQDYKKLSDEQLQEHYANTNTTAMVCGGHGKSEHNRRRCAMALGEMKSRKIKPDERDGQFNGNGSF